MEAFLFLFSLSSQSDGTTCYTVESRNERNVLFSLGKPFSKVKRQNKVRGLERKADIVWTREGK